jgi:hypothetical protein
VNYTPEDYVEFYNDRIRAEHSKRGWIFVAVLAAIAVGSILLGGCTDYADAANTAKNEQEAYETNQTVAAWWYSETYAPFKASQANAIISVCQSSDSTINWYCYAGSKK